jgi:hypothetical protein
VTLARAWLALSVVVASAGGCAQDVPPPAGQALVYIDTDAPPALFDRLRLEVFPPGAEEACAGCTREFGVDASTFSVANASIGVVPRPGTHGYRVRARLFRSAGTSAGEPRPGSTIPASFVTSTNLKSPSLR